MTTLNMPLDIAKDLLRTSEEYAALNPALAEDMAKRAFEIGKEFDVIEQLGRPPALRDDGKEETTETPTPARQYGETEEATSVEDDLDDDLDEDDQDALLSLLNLQRNLLFENPDQDPQLRRRPKAHLSLVSPTE